MKACENQKPHEPTTAAKRLIKDESAATTLEWALLLGAIAIPAAWLVMRGIDIIAFNYVVIMRFTNCPFP